MGRNFEMKQIRRLLKIVSFVLLCFVTDVNSTQVNIAGSIYKFDRMYRKYDQVAGSLTSGPYRWHQLLENINGTHILTAENLRYHLIRIWNNQERGVTGRIIPRTSILRELARMLLAQIPAAGRVNHNVAENNSVAYMIRERITDVYKSCGELKKHLLEHGHLGYFPMFSVMKENPQVKVNKLIPRGIFNIPFNVASRIANHHNLTIDTLHLSPNILPNIELPVMFAVDPDWRRGSAHPNLESVTNGLINSLLSENNIVDVHVSDVINNRFTLDVTYNLANRIPGVTETQNIGYKTDGTVTNTVKIVVQVQNGIISIVTMYPV